MKKDEKKMKKEVKKASSLQHTKPLVSARSSSLSWTFIYPRQEKSFLRDNLLTREVNFKRDPMPACYKGREKGPTPNLNSRLFSRNRA